MKDIEILETFPQQEGRYFLAGPAGKLEVAFHYPKEIVQPSLIGIVCHPHPLYGGTMDNKVVTTVVRTFRQMNIPSIRFNFRGVGQSEGQYGEAIGEIEDLKAVMNWVKQQNIHTQFCLAGFSFGSFIAAKVAYDPAVKQLISIAPPVHHFDFQTLKDPNCPWLVVQGDQDEVVSPALVFQWVKETEFNLKLRVLRGATHFFHGQLTELRDVLYEELAHSLT